MTNNDPIIFTCSRCGAKGNPPDCDHFMQAWSLEDIAEKHAWLKREGLLPGDAVKPAPDDDDSK
jgi:hypothetical protein